MLPYLDCLNCENWECMVLERGGAWQKRDSQTEEVVLENIGEKEGGRREGEERENGGQGGKKLQEAEDEDWGWKIKLGNRGRFQRCVDSNAGDSQVWKVPVGHSQLPWVSIHLPSGSWKPTELSVLGEDSEQYASNWVRCKGIFQVFKFCYANPLWDNNLPIFYSDLGIIQIVLTRKLCLPYSKLHLILTFLL